MPLPIVSVLGFSLYCRALFTKGFFFLPELYAQADAEWESIHSDLQAAWLLDAPLFDFDTVIEEDVGVIPLDLDLAKFDVLDEEGKVVEKGKHRVDPVVARRLVSEDLGVEGSRELEDVQWVLEESRWDAVNIVVGDQREMLQGLFHF